MEILNLKDTFEKDSFFRKLPNIAEQLPREIVLKKVLPKSQVEPSIHPFMIILYLCLFVSNQPVDLMCILIVWVTLCTAAPCIGFFS